MCPARLPLVPITLHWLVGLLVAAQYATGGSIEWTRHAAAHGHEVNSFDLIPHKIHNRTGLIILGLMPVRLAMRLSIRVPDQLGSRSDWRARVARAAHLSFYVVLIAQASTGAIAGYLFWPVARFTSRCPRSFWRLIALHASAAPLAFLHRARWGHDTNVDFAWCSRVHCIGFCAVGASETLVLRGPTDH